jgi:hypothetical protein
VSDEAPSVPPVEPPPPPYLPPPPPSAVAPPYGPPPIPPPPLQEYPGAYENWWDRQVLGTPEWLLYLFACLCGCPALIMAILCFTQARTPEGKDKAKRLLIFSGIVMGVSIVLNLIRAIVQIATQSSSSPVP